jgi:multiple sugar transport system permease protein
VSGKVGLLRGPNAKRWMIAYALVAPVVLWRLATSVYPFLYTAYLSFFDNSPIRRSHEFIGLDNYVAMVRDPDVKNALFFTVFFTVISVALQVVLGLGIAELLTRPFRGRNVARAVNLLPWAMSPIVIGIAAVWIFNQDYGLVNDLIWRVSGARPLWLIDVTGARFAVTLTDVWKNTAFLAVIFIAGLQGIPDELYEAGKIDGASGPRLFWHITLPLLMPLIISMAIFTAVFRVISFEIVYALTQGGPGTATALMSYLVYLQGFRVLNFGYASALSMGLFFMVLIIGLVGFVLLRRSWARV